MSDDWLRQALSAHKRGDHAATLRACAEAPADSQSQVRARSVRASALARLGRSAEALDEIRAVRELGARSIEIFHLAAKICTARGELGAACDWLDRGLVEHPTSKRTLELRERVVLDMHLLSGLHEHLELVVALHPGDLEARRKLISSYLRLNLFDLAGEQLDAALAHHPRQVSLYLEKAIVGIETGRPEIAVDALEQALAQDAATSDRLRITLLFIKAGALDRALRTAQENCALAPDSVAIRLQGGCLALWQGDVQAAKDACSALPERTPGRVRLGAAIAFVEDRPDIALSLATEAVAEDGADGEAQALRAGALLHLSRHAEAEAAARHAAHTARAWVPAAQLVEAAARAAQYPTTRGFQVAELFQSMAALWPAPLVIPGTHADVDSTSVYAALDAGLRRLSGNFTSVPTFLAPGGNAWALLAAKLPARTACVRAFEGIQARPFAWVAERMTTLAEAYPRTPFVHTHTAELHLWNGEYAACEAECRRAIALTETESSRWAWVGLGAALMLQDRLAEALEVFAESERLAPPGAPLLAYRGETLRRCGRLDAAEQELTRSLALSATRVSAWFNLALIAAARGRYDELRDLDTRLRKHVPQLFRDVERDMNLRRLATGGSPDRLASPECPAPSPGRPGDAAAITATLEHALRVMRGNRSSNRITYLLVDGRARVLTARALPSETPL